MEKVIYDSLPPRYVVEYWSVKKKRWVAGGGFDLASRALDRAQGYVEAGYRARVIDTQAPEED